MTSSTLRLAFSHDIFSSQQAGGISRCMLELMKSLAEQDAEWVAWVGMSKNDLLDASVKETWASGKIVQQRHGYLLPSRLAGIANEVAFSQWIARNRPAILHRTYYPPVNLAGSKMRRVETLHDMWDEQAHRNGCGRAGLRSRIKYAALLRADLIICVSESTRQELLSIWPWAAEKCLVIHHGVRLLSDRPLVIKRARPFFLFVGRRGHYKNFGLVIGALRAAGLSDHELICFGGGDFSAPELELIDQNQLSGRVHQVNGDDARLAGLYEAAEALLYPSFYEGFGLPLLEAMIHNCPVVTTPLTSLPEVGGEAPLYISPEDVDGWADAITKLAGSPSFRAKIVARGLKRVRHFTWAATARAHVAAYSTLS